MRLIKILAQDGAGVFEGVGVFDGVRVTVGVSVFVGVRVGTGVLVAVGVKVKVGVKVMVGVFVGTVGPINGSGVLMARTARNCSTIPSRYEARWIMEGCMPKAGRTIKVKL